MGSNSLMSKWGNLSDLSEIIKRLSQQKCVAELDNLFQHMEILQTKIREQEATIKQQEETMMAKSNETIRLKKEHQDRQEEIIETNASLLRKKDDEKQQLNQTKAIQEKAFDEAKSAAELLREQVQTLQNQLQTQKIEAKKIESQLHDDRVKIERLNETVKGQKEQIKLKEQQLLAERKSHEQSRSQLDALSEKAKQLEADLRDHTEKLDHINKIAPPLIEDDVGDVSKTLRKIWKLCFHLGQGCFRETNPLEQIQDSTRWRNLQTSHLVTYAVPLPPTNSAAARRMRFFALLAILADNLVRNVFNTTYHLGSAEEIDRLLLEMADSNQYKSTLFRRLLNSASTEDEDQLINFRVTKVVNEVTGYFEPLLSVSQSEKMKTDIAEMLKLAASLWKSLQRRQSYFAVEPQSPSQTQTPWRSLIWDSKKKEFSEESATAPQDVVLVLFPRIIMIGQEGEREIFPGIVLLKPETSAAHAEVSELTPTSPTLARSGTNRSISGRRGTMDRKTENGAFLAQNGSQQSCAP